MLAAAMHGMLLFIIRLVCILELPTSYEQLLTTTIRNTGNNSYFLIYKNMEYLRNFIITQLQRNTFISQNNIILIHILHTILSKCQS